MVAAYDRVTIDLSKEDRELLDEIRGDLDPATYLLKTIRKTAKRSKARLDMPLPVSDAEPTTEEHLQMAARAHEDSLDIDEFFQKLQEDIARDRAARRGRAGE